MNKSKRLKVLLEKGYFPAELPPPFVTGTLAKFRTSILNDWATLNAPPRCQFESYSYPRVGRRRRALALVNPISQLHLSKKIADNWIEIRDYISTSNISLDSPILHETAGRATPKPDFNLIGLKRLDTSARFEHILVSDISRFYGTIYTHTLPWALHGKDFCKANLNNKTVMQALLGDQLDTLVRKGQDNQTIGIPIGPDTSRILAEIIAVGIEKHFLKTSGYAEERVFRYVDDWFLGFDHAGEAEDAIAFLSKSCSEYELEINDQKTTIVDPIDPVEELWPDELREHKFRTSQYGQAQDIKHFFTKTFHFAAAHKDQNVLDFALKRSRSVDVHIENSALYESYVVRAARINPTSFPTAAQILINMKNKGMPLSADKIRKLIFDTIKKTAMVGRHGELSWALFLAKGLGVKIPNEVIRPVLGVESSVCALLTLDLNSLGLIEGTINTHFWESFMTIDSLKSNMWLLSYEADIKGWLPSPNNHVSSHNYFKSLKQRGVYFYDKKRNVLTFKRSFERQSRENVRRFSNLNMLRLIAGNRFRSM